MYKTPPALTAKTPRFGLQITGGYRRARSAQLPDVLVHLMAVIAAEHHVEHRRGWLPGDVTGLGINPGIHALNPPNHPDRRAKPHLMPAMPAIQVTLRRRTCPTPPSSK